MGDRSRQSDFELKFCPSLELIPIVRRFVEIFYSQLLAQDDVAARIALATHELLENSVKFSSDGMASIHIGVAAQRDRPKKRRNGWLQLP